MKTKQTWKRLVSLMVAIVVLLGTVIPLSIVEVDAEYVWVPSSMVTCNSAFKVGKTISVVIKGIGAISYASAHNENGGVREWATLAMAYFSGNADENEQIADLKSTMISQFKATQNAIEDLRKEISDLRQDMTQQLSQLDNTVECAYLKSALDQFYTEFFVSAYSDLETAYLNIIETLNDPGANEATIRAKMDDLYMKAYKLKSLQDYITGEIRFNNESILNLYYEYMLRANNIQSTDTEGYQRVLEDCQDFTLKLFAADSFQKYCLAYASSYQLNYVYENLASMTEQGAFVGYTLEGTLDGSSNKLTLQEIQRNIAKIEDDTAVVSAKVATNLSKMYLLNTYIGYTENGCQYFAPMQNNTASVYVGATYQMFALPSDLANLFGYDFSFVTSNENVITLTDTGYMTITGEIGSSFTVSYVYGKDRLEQPITVYSIDFQIVDRKWAGGYGNAEAPYLISSVAHLKDFTSDNSYWATGSHIKLISDLDLSGQTISQISEFSGVFDGDNHVIKNLSTGLFAKNNGEIKNLILDHLSISSQAYGGANIGGIVNNNNGVITNCHVRNSKIDVYRHNFTGSSGYTSFEVVTGGIAGTGTNGSLIQYCSVTNSTLNAEISTRELFDAGKLFDQDDMTIYATIKAGGIVGSTDNTSVNNCYVGQTTISTETYAKYYKWSFLWEHTYNRVNAKVYTGIIAGNNSGTFDSNIYYDSNNDTNPINKYAASKTDNDFVTFGLIKGVQGVASSTVQNTIYTSSLQIDTLPYQTVYKLGKAVNISGLTVVDNHQNPIYGYTVKSDNMSAEGKRSVVIEYSGLSTTFSVDFACQHKNIRYVSQEFVDCTLGGYTAGIFCNDCQTYIDGHDVISKGSCIDVDKNHICDSCNSQMGIHEATKGSHICKYCGIAVTDCTDSNKDHFCDVCNTSIGNHAASDGQHICNYCGKIVTVCDDANKDHVCDICGDPMGTHVAANNAHTCEYCGVRITDCADLDKNHACDTCGLSMGVHIAATGKHACDYCGVRMTDCADLDKNHACDTCGLSMGVHIAATGKHACDYCGVRMTDCADLDKNHACDTCGLSMGVHIAATGKHACDYCGVRMTDCADLDKNHACDTCGLSIGVHIAATGKHACDYCGVRMTDCVDLDKNHACDTCGLSMGTHTVATGKHICNYCGVQMTDCTDLDKNHACDICGAFMGQHIEATGRHNCEYCGSRITNCSDANADHTCDVCGIPMGNHAASDNTHICDYCGVQVTYCCDLDQNHNCDVCGLFMGVHAAIIEKHTCDYCGVQLTVCSDDNNDNLCDICNAPFSTSPETDSITDTESETNAHKNEGTVSNDDSNNTDTGTSGCSGSVNSNMAIMISILALAAFGIMNRGKKRD